MPSPSLLGRLALLTSLAVAGLALVVGQLLGGQFLGRWFIRDLEAELTARLEAAVELTAETWHPGLGPASREELAVHLAWLLGGRVSLIGLDGEVWADSAPPPANLAGLENLAHSPEIVQALRSGRGVDLVEAPLAEYPELNLALVIPASVEPRGILRLNRSVPEVKGLRTRLAWAGLIAALVALGLGFLGAAWLSRRFGRPLLRCQAVLDLLGQGRQGLRVRRYPENELGRLARAIDRLADRFEADLTQATQAQERFQAVLQAMAEGLLVLDQDGRVALANPAFLGLFSLSDDPAGRRLANLLRQTDLLEAAERVLAGQPHRSLELRIKGPRPRTVEVHLVTLRDPAGPAGLVAVFHDLTERRRTEAVRRDFVANVSHELRTPLAAVRGAAETLLGGALEQPEAARRFAEMILRQAVRLQALTDDLLSLARLEWEGTKLEITPIPAGDLLEAVLTAVDEPAAARQVVLEGQAIQPEAAIQADRAKLEQALVNLVDNAVKYSRPGGRVVIRVEVQPGQARLSVADQGVGIPTEDLERIFERFYRVDKDRSRTAGGTGLGLAIVKHVAQLHGGRVEVVSTLGQGSTFTLVLPQTGPVLPGQAPLS